MTQDNIGNLWFGTSNGVSRYDGITFTSFTTVQGLADNTVYSAIIDKQENIVGLRQAYENGDNATVGIRTEEIINQIVGNQSDQFLDHNNDGSIDNTPGELPADGYGSLPNGTQNGYIQETTLQAKLASAAIDSTPSIRTNSEKLQICIVAGTFPKIPGDLQCAQTVEPEPR